MQITAYLLILLFSSQSSALVETPVPDMTKGLRQILCVGFKTDDEITIEFGTPVALPGRYANDTVVGDGKVARLTYQPDGAILTLTRSKDQKDRVIVQLTIPMQELLLLTTDGRPSKASMLPLTTGVFISKGQIKPL
jgi:hypothetical protein